MNFSTTPFQEKIPKPWGEEIKFTPGSLKRAGKLLLVKAGKRLSFQYHDEKEETLCLFSGKALLWLENADGVIDKIPMEMHKGYTVIPPQKHRIETLDDCVIVEVSSPETGTTVRLEDDYARKDETEEVRMQKNRGWNGNADNNNT